MSGQPDAPAEQIIVVKRGGHGDHDSHHGGVWKIAYADFMTAMMAFFLVMWLINVANTETKARVASYFNPIKLTDPASLTKGMHKIDDKVVAKDSRSKASSAGDQKASSPTPTPKSEQNEGISSAGHERMTDSGNENTRVSGRRLKDPFDPFGDLSNIGSSDDRRTMSANRNTSTKIDSTAGQSPSELNSKRPDASLNLKTKATDSPEGERRAQAERLLDKIRQVAQLGGAMGPGIETSVEGDYIVLSLTDTANFEMFSVGSAEPNRDLVSLLERLTPEITRISDHIIIRGHTDARPFKGDGKNNWRLSMERAGIAHTMLTRAGIAEDQIVRIEAHADRRLKLPQAPLASTNRRIEILIRQATAR